MRRDALDPPAIAAALGCADATTFTPVLGSSDTAIWQVTTPTATYALRVFVSEDATACARECAVLRYLAGYDVPVPRVQAVGAWQGYPAMLITWLPGRTIADALRAQPWRAWQLGVIFGRAQARLHAIPAPEELRGTPDGWIAWGQRQPAALQARLRAIPHRSDALLHLDFHPLNVLTDGQRITGIIDWVNAQAGDPRADVVRTETIFRLDSDQGATGLAKYAQRAGIALFLRGWRHGYTQIAPKLANMPLFNAWAGAAMEADLAAKRDPAALARIHRWTARWLRQIT